MLILMLWVDWGLIYWEDCLNFDYYELFYSICIRFDVYGEIGESWVYDVDFLILLGVCRIIMRFFWVIYCVYDLCLVWVVWFWMMLNFCYVVLWWYWCDLFSRWYVWMFCVVWRSMKNMVFEMIVDMIEVFSFECFWDYWMIRVIVG